ncbi:MAG: hypothetical protein Q9185_002835 [Variospora sp. 1 TL-2023]
MDHLPRANGSTDQYTHPHSDDEVKSKQGSAGATKDSETGLEKAMSRITSRTSYVDPGPPDGGVQAWTQSLAGHLVVFNTWGLINSFGVFQTYYITALNHPPSDISWIGSIQIFLLFFVGTFSGRATDYGLFRTTFILGSILQLVGVFMTSLSTRYWQLILSQGIATGLGNGLLFCPSLAVLSTYFSSKRAVAIAIAASGSATGGLVFPAIVQQLLPMIGFGWTVRVLGFVILGLQIIAFALAKPRLPPRKSGPIVEWSAFRELPYTLFSIGMFLTFWGLYFAFYYVGSFGRDILGISQEESINNLLIMNGVGLVGRMVPAFFADRYFGPLNSLIPFVFISGLLIFCWAAVTSKSGLTAFSVIYGLFAAGIQSLFPATTSSLTTDMKKTGVRMGMVFSIVSLASLTGSPLAGALIQERGGSYLYAQMFSGTVFFCVVGIITRQQFRTALHDFCRRNGTVEMIDQLVQAGLEIDAQDADGERPLLNFNRCFTASAEKLINFGADLNACSVFSRESSIRFAVESDRYHILPSAGSSSELLKDPHDIAEPNVSTQSALPRWRTKAQCSADNPSDGTEEKCFPRKAESHPLIIQTDEGIEWYGTWAGIHWLRSPSYPRHRIAKNVENERASAHRPRPKLEDSQDIYVDDLDATLEAHRATNRAKIIRRIRAGTDPCVKHMVIDRPNDNGSLARNYAATKPNQGAKEKVMEVSAVEVASSAGKRNALKASDFWPPGSIQHQKLAKSPPRLMKGSIQEYHARAMVPIGSWRCPSEECGHTDWFRPWLNHMSEPGGDALERLGHEITAFERYVTPSMAALNASKKVVSQIKQVISSTIDHSSSEVIGSYKTGLAMPWSDIDVAVSLPAIEKEAAAHQKSLRGRQYLKIHRNTLYKLKAAISRDPNFDADVEHIFARVPIVRAKHRQTGVEVEIQMRAGSCHQHQHVLAYLVEYPTLRPLYFILRSCLELRRLTIPFEGGLGSYAILMLIVNALKHAPGRYAFHDVASQLLHVLDFYAKSDLYHNGFSVDPPRMFSKAKLSLTTEERLLRAADPVLRGIDSMAAGNPRQPYLLCLQDPADPRNDLGSKAYAIKHIQATFSMARKTITGAMGVWNRRSDLASHNGAKLGLLDALVCGNYEQFNSDRNKVAVYGCSKADATAPDRKVRITAHEMLQKVIEMDNRRAAESVGLKSEGSKA